MAKEEKKKTNTYTSDTTRLREKAVKATNASGDGLSIGGTESSRVGLGDFGAQSLSLWVGTLQLNAFTQRARTNTFAPRTLAI